MSRMRIDTKCLSQREKAYFYSVAAAFSKSGEARKRRYLELSTGESVSRIAKRTKIDKAQLGLDKHQGINIGFEYAFRFHRPPPFPKSWFEENWFCNVPKISI